MPPIGSGVNSLYNDEHLKRINLIKKLQAEYMPLNKIREYILDNPEVVDDVCIKEVKKHVHSDMYVKENVCDIFEIHCSCDNYEKYSYIIENVKKYVEKMMEDQYENC